MAYEFYYCGGIKEVNEYMGFFQGATTISVDIAGKNEHLILASADFALVIPIKKIGIPYIVKMVLQDKCLCKITSNEKTHELVRHGIEINNISRIQNLFLMCGLPNLTLEQVCALVCPDLVNGCSILNYKRKCKYQMDIRLQACCTSIITYNIFTKLCLQHPSYYPKLDVELIIRRILLHRLPTTLLKFFETYHNLLNCKGIIDKLYLFLMIIFSARDEDLIVLGIERNYLFCGLKSVDDAINCLANIYLKPHPRVVNKLKIKGFGMDKTIIIRSDATEDDLVLMEYSEADLLLLVKELKSEPFVVPSLVVHLKKPK